MTKRILPPVVLVFGEDDNDKEAAKELMMALRPDFPPVRKRRKPLVLVKGRTEARARKNTADIAKVVRADAKRSDVRIVFAHEDCDDIEPAHLALADRIETYLGKEGVQAIAVTPAWEMEAWWFLWPDAVVAVNSGWQRPSMSGRQVGLIRDAKEELRRALRPANKGKRTRDYEESDGPKIARKVRELGIVGTLDAQSDSYVRFRDKVLALVV